MDDAARSAIAPRLSIIVVSWNCRDLALRCLAEIAGSRIGCPYEIILIDNASTDGTAAAVATAFPDVRVVANTENAGFARANNQGMALAAGRAFLLLNPDAFPAGPETFAHLLAALDAHPEYAMLGCRLVHEDGRHQVGDAGRVPTPWHVLVHGLGLSQLVPSLGGLYLVRPPRGRAAPMDVDWICGACLLVRAEVVRRHGGLDETLFMYAEDVEWGCRLRAAGLRIGYLPGEAVLHLQGGTQGGNPTLKWLDNTANLYTRLNHGRAWFTFRASFASGFLIRAIAYRCIGLWRGNPLKARAHTMRLYARHAWLLRRP